MIQIAQLRLLCVCACACVHVRACVCEDLAVGVQSPGCWFSVSLSFAARLWRKVAQLVRLRDGVCVTPGDSTRWKCVLHNPDTFLCLASGLGVGLEGAAELLSLECCSEAPAEFKECSSFCPSLDGHFWSRLGGFLGPRRPH